ncbi:MAG TPA: hypothetical protein VK897_15195 [Anaerolineales bacterium]|nr:hypothetical protein [Anaerolineales bacterium]
MLIPLSHFLIGPISVYNLNWFFPAFMFVMGMHYILFIFLYGMWEFAVLAVALLIGGLTIGALFPGSFTPGGWFAGIVLVLFALFVSIKNRMELST